MCLYVPGFRSTTDFKVNLLELSNFYDYGNLHRGSRPHDETVHHAGRFYMPQMPEHEGFLVLSLVWKDILLHMCTIRINSTSCC